MPSWVPIGGDLLSAKHIANQMNRYEPQRAANFELLISPPGGVSGDILLKSVETSLAISHSSEPIALPYMNETVFIAGRPMYAPGSVSYRDMVTEAVWETIERWYSKIYNVESSEIGFASEYKSMGTLTMYDVKGGHSRSWELIGIWPQDISSETPSYVGGDIFRVNVTFHYDKAKPTFAY
jgi:hypothetical protein